VSVTTSNDGTTLHGPGSRRRPISRRFSRSTHGVLIVAICLTAQVLLVPPSHATEPVHPADSTAVTAWNSIALRTIFTENGAPIPSSGLYFGFVSIAVFDAVVSIEGGYRPYAYHRHAPQDASAPVAAATAAYQVLRHYFPSSAGNLDRDYAAFLAASPDGAGEAGGQYVGEAAAAAIIRLRRDDGRDAAIQLAGVDRPGAWRPTPPGFLPMLVPWLGFVKPLALRSARQIRLSGPDPISSARYARDWLEVKNYGAKDGSSRSPEQTETAMFWNANSVAQYQVAMADQVTRRGLDIAAGARSFALLGTATGDAMITCWRAKYDYAYWRPITAIALADTDGNPATRPDPQWQPLVTTPSYPDYASGHACITGAASATMAELFGANSLDLNVQSSVTGTSRHYASAAALDQETMNARIWLGLHFRKAMTDGNRIGRQAAEWTASRNFQSTRRDHRS